MIKLKNISFILFISLALPFVELLINPSFGTVLDGDLTYENPFLGGFNKPKIQWLDWNNDNIDDLFLLDEDGHIKYYIANQNCNRNDCFTLESTSFYNFSNILWFYIDDFDNDGFYEIITSNKENTNLVSYYNFVDDLFVYEGNIIDNEGTEISIDPTMVPCFADIDNDNDLDLFSGNVIGTVNFFKNQGIDNNLPVFNLETNYWQEIYIVGSSLNQRHGASAINFNDLDDDGDLDLSWGDYFQQSLYIIWNIGTSENPLMDNKNILNQFPLNDPILTSGLNMPSFTDIDLDGDKDLFVTTLSGAFGYQLINNFTYYENQNNEYIKQSSNFISTIDILSDVNPTFVDIDNDNDLDLFIGTDFDPSSFPWVGKINYYENIGQDANGEILLVKATSDFLNNAQFTENNLYPDFVDIDNDDDYDLFVGDFNGLVHYFNNVGDVNNPNMKYIGSIGDIDLSGYSTPEFIDIDDDGDYDLFIGNASGTILHYENIGDKYNFDFVLKNNNYENINVNFRSSILFLNINCRLDFIVSNGFGDILYYKDNDGKYILSNDLIYPFLGLNLSLDFYKNNNYQGIISGNGAGGLYFTDFLGENLIGDLNSDQIINVVDIVSLVQNILDESEYICSYDLNQDTIINVVDIIALVGIILSSN
tara:strand:- start:58 stop:2004 length:1947 start_codon:yes stop_codon:yes gene_type:complete